MISDSGHMRGRAEAGFTMLELLIVVAVIGIVAAIGVPCYAAALRTARVGKAKHEMASMMQAIEMFALSHNGQLPLTLHQVGFGTDRDPWGNRYCYLNYADGTGDGLGWAVAAGLVDPGALFADAAANGARPAPSLCAFLPIVGPTAHRPIETQAQESTAMQRARSIAARVPRELSPQELQALADAITTSGNFTLFVQVQTDQARRRDRNSVPLNASYDLYSIGPNATSAASLGEGAALDDVVRANNGGFVGLASEY